MLTLFPRYSFVLFLDKKDDEVQQQEPDFARRRLDDAAAAAADRSGIGDNTVDVIAIVYIVSILLLKCSADALCVSFFMNNGRQPQLRRYHGTTWYFVPCTFFLFELLLLKTVVSKENFVTFQT